MKAFFSRFRSQHIPVDGRARGCAVSLFVLFPIPLLLPLLALLFSTPPLSAAWVYESTNEFFSSADFDGDGRTDLVIVDKAAGHYRLGYQLTADALTWASPRSSGIEDVTGFSVARFFNAARESLAFTATAANRVNLFDASSSETAGLPVTATFGRNGSELGPNLVVGLDIGGAGNTSLHDLLVGTIWNSPPDSHRLVLVRNRLGNTFSDVSYFNVTGPLEHGNVVTLKTGTPARAGVMLPGRSSSAFFALDTSTGTIAVPLLTTNLPLGARFVATAFNSASSLVQFLFYVPGRADLLRYPLSERTPGVLEFGTATTFTLPASIRQVVMLPGAADTKLLIIFGNGESATVYDFNGVSVPTPVQSFTAPAGESFTGAGALAGNGMVMFSGSGGAAMSTAFQTWNFNGTSYTPGQSGKLPVLNRLTASANVFLFNREPFVNNAPILLRSVNARDWSSLLTGLPGGVTVQAESFVDASNGLRNPVAVTLGAAPATTTAGLVNQYRDPIALFGFSPADGDTPGDLTFHPEPGSFSSGVSVTLANSAAATIYYRFNDSSAWTAYALPNDRIWLFKTTTIHAYAEVGNGGPRSRIKTATYTITTPPGELDTDGDGVPDYVEIAKGTDPTRPDSDRDGYSDLDELLNNSGPLDSNSRPATVIERQVTFDLEILPFLSVDGGQFLPQPGTPGSMHNLTGSLLAAGETRQFLSMITIPFTGIPLDSSRRLYSYSITPAYPVLTVGTPLPVPPSGRELVGLIPVPAITPPMLTNAYLGLDVTSEANAWITDSAARLQSVQRLALSVPLTPNDTLTAALTEHAIGTLLVSRGDPSGTNLTIFPARAKDVTRYAPGYDVLASIEPPEPGPAYSLPQILSTVQGAVYGGSDADVQALRRITEAIYRISMFAVETSGLHYPLPLDVLRQYIHTGNIHSNYFAARRTTPEEFSASDLAAGRRALTNILSAVQPRPTTNVTLRIRGDTYAGSCTLLENTSTLTRWALVDGRGTPYRFVESFHLVPGTQVQVFGFLDAPPNACSATSLEVASIDLVSVPSATDADLDGNQLPDSWESLHGLSDPNGDADGDGLTNLQESQAGTDPRDAQSHAVITLADSGPGSLRQAILHANTTPGHDSIRFNIPGPGVQTIAPLTPLPAITAPLTLDGYSQPGARPNTLPVGNNAILLIELSGQNVAAPADGLGLSITTNCSVRGLCLNRWTGNAINALLGEGHHITGNFIGTDPSGNFARTNGQSGVVLNNSSRNRIGGVAPTDRNVIAASREEGIVIHNIVSMGNRIEGNYIGINAAGTAALGNLVHGVRVNSSGGNTIGGTLPGAGNVISGNGSPGGGGGVGIWHESADNHILGNRIGTDAAGLSAIPNIAGLGLQHAMRTVIGGTSPAERNIISGNAGAGISTYRSSFNVIQGNFIGTDVNGSAPLGNGDDGVAIYWSTNNLIGGTDAGAGNVISGNGLNGVGLGWIGASSSNNVVQGNIIGLDPSGAFAVPNGNRFGYSGIDVIGSSHNQIGGPTPAARNVISGNLGAGVRVGGLEATHNVIQGNYIGTDATGLNARGNGLRGVVLENASANVIGGMTPEAANVIAYNTAQGVAVYGDAAVGNIIARNLIFANTSIGIDLGLDDFTLNDVGDVDTGPNQLQNFPVLTTARTILNGTAITGLLNSQPNRTFRLEFFASTAGDPGGYGEGERFLGSTSIATDSSGIANFDFLSVNPVFNGEFISATATDPDGNTSEFSEALRMGISDGIPLLLGATSASISLPPPIAKLSSTGWDARPRLTIEASSGPTRVHRLSWPAAATGWRIEWSADLRTWKAIDWPARQVEGSWETTVDASAMSSPMLFFRLVKRP